MQHVQVNACVQRVATDSECFYWNWGKKKKKKRLPRVVKALHQSVSRHLFCELSFHGVVIRIAGIAEQLAVRRIHDGDPELHDVLLVVFFDQVGVFFDLSVTKRKDDVVR